MILIGKGYSTINEVYTSFSIPLIDNFNFEKSVQITLKSNNGSYSGFLDINPGSLHSSFIDSDIEINI